MCLESFFGFEGVFEGIAAYADTPVHVRFRILCSVRYVLEFLTSILRQLQWFHLLPL